MTTESEPYLKTARDTIESYKAAELRDYFRDDCVDQTQARVTKVDVVSPSTAIIYPIVFPDRTELLVSFPDGLKRIPVPVPASTLTAEVRAFRRMLEKRTTREYLPACSTIIRLADPSPRRGPPQAQREHARRRP